MITLSGIVGANFITNKVKIGDTVSLKTIKGNAFNALTNYLLKSGTNPLSYDSLLVASVISESSIGIEAYKNGVNLNISDTNLNITTSDAITFDIIHNLTKDEQVDNIIAIARSYANKRTVLAWPPKADWLINGEYVTLDGSAIAAAFAAAKSNYPAHQSFTNLPFSGPYKLYYSNNYFNPAQLKRMTNAGVMVFMQDADGAQIYTRHQKTTSTTSIQEQEYSITCAVDAFAKGLKATCKPKVGKYNITPELLTDLAEVIDTYRFECKNKKYAYCGSLIIGSKNVSIRANLEGENTDLPKGTVEISVEIEVGYPANYINVTVLVD